MKKPVHYCLLLLLLCNNTLLLIAQDEQPYILKPVGDEAYEAILQFYQYDRDIPLEVQIVETVDNEKFKREKIVFTGIMNSRVVGYLATPKNTEPPSIRFLTKAGDIVCVTWLFRVPWNTGEPWITLKQGRKLTQNGLGPSDTVWEVL